MTDHKATKKRALEYFCSIFSRKWRFFAILIVGIVSALLAYRHNQADRGTLIMPQKLSIKWPENMVSVSPLPAPAIVARRTIPDGFPTVNVIEVPGEIDRDPTVRVVDSYRAMGITDIRTQKSPYPASIELHFTSQGEAFSASVTTLAGDRERHYVWTYLDHAEKFTEHRPILAALMDELLRLSYHP